MMGLGADRLLRIIIPLFVLGGCASIDKLRVLYSWKSLDFAFPNDLTRQLAIREGRFIPGAAVPIDVDFYHRGFKQFLYCKETFKV